LFYNNIRSFRKVRVRDFISNLEQIIHLILPGGAHMRSKLFLASVGVLGVVLIFALALASGVSPNAAFMKPAGDESPPSGTRQTCPDGTTFGQTPVDPAGDWHLTTSDTGPSDGPYVVYDNFTNAGTVNEIEFWGVRAYFDGVSWSECIEDPMTFEIIFYDDNAGQPGTAVATYNVNLNATPTGIVYSGVVELMEWHATLSPAPPVATGTYWVSIQGIVDPACWFLWASSQDGDANSYQWQSTTLVPLDYDEAFCLIGGADCNWQDGDPYKMHFPQMPDTVGWDVNATYPMVLADDWQCSDTGWVKDFHFWGSWKDDIVGDIQYFILSIHSNIPEGGGYGQCFADGDCDGNGVTLTVADLAYLISYVFQGGNPCVPWYSGDLNGDCVVDARDIVVFQNYLAIGLPAFDPYGGYPVPTCCDSIIYSRPGETLWESEVSDFGVVPFDPPTLEGWYDPANNEVLPDNHQAYFQYNICLPEADWFWQEQGMVYWLNISAVVADPAGTHWGWKSCYDHFMDDAVWAEAGNLQWQEIYEPANPKFNQFWIAIDQQGVPVGPLTGGTDFFGDGWYFYEQSEWWNIWFYDDPFTYQREKIAHFEFDVFPYVEGDPTWFTFAINWSTDAWSQDQPPEDSTPPLPGAPEELYIGRAIYLDGPVSGGHYIFEWRMPDYNPEWVSIDVQGYNFIIPEGIGFIDHTCRQSLDLAFVVTGGEQVPTGACCYDDANGMLCTETTQDSCLNFFFGTYMGDGTVCGGVEACCLQDGSCINADALCCTDVLGGTPQGAGTSCSQSEACCLPNGECIMVDPLCCDDLGGSPQGPGTSCSALEACCLQNGQCVMVDPLCCDDLGGTPQGAGSQCTQPAACCLSDGSCINVDPVCCDDLGGVPDPTGAPCQAVEACCFTDGSCDTLSPYCCTVLGGDPKGPGTICLGDFDPQNGIDDACENPEGACCFDDGSCAVLSASDCAAQSGTYMGDGTVCFGDHNQNGQDDLCEDPWQPGDGHKMHYPQLPDEAGWDVRSTDPVFLADDWRCSGTGWVSDLHFWGSWRNGLVGRILFFVFRIYDDIPAEQSPTGYSMPGVVLWEFETDRFGATPIDPPSTEGWFDPVTGEEVPDDHQAYFQYDVYFDTLTQEAFLQEEGTIYWIGITAVLEDATNYQWGWKSSVDHFNDDAVWSLSPNYDWIELYEPGTGSGFPYTPGDVDGDGDVDNDDVNALSAWIFNQTAPGSWTPDGSLYPAGDVDGDCFNLIFDVNILAQFVTNGTPPLQYCPNYPPGEPAISLDLSFVITGGRGCDCTPGDADGNGLINISDAVYLVGYIFGGGPAPTPYPICSGDADCNCLVNISDAVYLISYIFGGGPAPCPCQQWLTNCGPPLR
jgi:hypothetical protein